MFSKKLLTGFVLLMALIFSALPVFAGGSPDMKGQDIVLGNFWEDYDVATFKPINDIQERELEWRKKIQTDNGFKMRTRQIADWGGMLQTVATSIMAGKPEANGFWVTPDWAMTLYKRKLLAVIPDEKFLKNSTSIAGKQVAYNQDIAALFTFDKKQYALGVGYGGSDHGAGIYFNKRLFREAGLEQDLPYDLQKSGKWTWDEYLRICKILTRDTRNTGRINTWAMTADLSDQILDLIVFSNGANYIGKNAQGRFTNATNTPAFIESLQFARKLMAEGVMMPRPDGSEWNWYFPAFYDGIVAMMMEAEWQRSRLQDMKDDWGFVLFPKGPRAKDYRFPNDENVLVIPATFKPDQVNKILYAINLWYTPVSDNWKEGLYPFFRDRRAVDETTAMIRSPKYGAFRNYIMIPGLQRGDIAWMMWWYDGEPAQLVEEVSQNWNSLIADANAIE